jgi:hypothetical protein
MLCAFKLERYNMTKQESYLQHIARAEELGLSLSVYARQNSLSAQRLYAARYSAKRGQSSLTSFVPVSVCAQSIALHAVLPNGIELQFIEFSPEILRRLAELSCSR